MQYQEFIDFLQNVGKDPSRLIFEDELTGIHNRRFLHSYLEHRIRWDGDDYPLSLLVIDLDKFKQINDTHGHDIGDQVLTWSVALGNFQALRLPFDGWHLYCRPYPPRYGCPPRRQILLG